MTAKIEKIFGIQVILFIASILLVSFLMFYRLSVREVEISSTIQFKSELVKIASEINYRALIATERLKAVSSRTMIRKELYNYHIGKTSLDSLISFTKQKYADGVTVYNDLIASRRTDLKNQTIALYERKHIPLPEVIRGKDIAFFKYEAMYYLYLNNKIIHKGIHIGYDEAVFAISDFSAEDAILVKSLCIDERQNGSCVNNSGLHYEEIGKTGFYLKAHINEELLSIKKRGINLVIIFQTVLLIVTVGVISYFTILRLTMSVIKKLNHANLNLTSALNDKEMLFREMHHRIKNNLNIIINYLQMQSMNSSNTEFQEKNEEIINRIYAINNVHDKLQNSSDFTRLELGAYLNDLCRMIFETSPDKTIHLNVRLMSKVFFKTKQVIDLGMVFSELSINSIKHAYNSSPLEIDISLEIVDGYCILTYGDNGNPYPEDFDMDTLKSLGYVVIKNIVKSLNGVINYDFKKEKIITIRLPFDKAIQV